MREDPLWARIALLLNLAGTTLLFLSFQATSSDFRLVSTSDGRYALCVDRTALIIKEPKGFGIGYTVCPDWEHSKPAAVVNVEHPSFVTLGFIASILGFLLQLMTIPRRKTLAEVNEELRTLRKQKRVLEMQSLG